MIIDEIFSLYEGHGAAAYFGEQVTVTGHCLQAAYFAQQAGAPDALVLAALLHDVGHLIEAVPEDIADWKVDAHHEQTGSAWLASRFGPAVSEPVRLHVSAKRYLCATVSTYFDLLSSASVATLGLQGGPMSVAEVATFEAAPYFDDAVRLRRWDDQAKIPDLVVPALAHYWPLVECLAL